MELKSIQIDALDHIAKRLKGVVVENLDYADCVSEYDSESSLFFIDMPYLQANSRQYYEHSFTLENHKELRSLLNSIQGKAMFCHYEHPEIDKLYHRWNKYTFQSCKGSHKAGVNEAKPVTSECLYTNFKESCKQKILFEGMN
ncbi:MAG: DNA adenine methylase [Candidatus Jettenia sp. CY-1]|nr:MAG: DNA adenine methylase [Candidatus Jettenia sp. CY-1]